LCRRSKFEMEAGFLAESLEARLIKEFLPKIEAGLMKEFLTIN